MKKLYIAALIAGLSIGQTILSSEDLYKEYNNSRTCQVWQFCEKKCKKEWFWKRFKCEDSCESIINSHIMKEIDEREKTLKPKISEEEKFLQNIFQLYEHPRYESQGSSLYKDIQTCNRIKNDKNDGKLTGDKIACTFAKKSLRTIIDILSKGKKMDSVSGKISSEENIKNYDPLIIKRLENLLNQTEEGSNITIDFDQYDETHKGINLLKETMSKSK